MTTPSNEEKKFTSEILRDMFADLQPSTKELQVLNVLLGQILFDSNQKIRNELSHILDHWKSRVLFVSAAQEASTMKDTTEESDQESY